jgi:FeS assembly protein IscX
MSKEFSSREMKWLDIYDIAIALEESFPDEDVLNIRFTDLQKLVLSLEGFNDDIKNCNERVLEAIQQAWIDER